VRDAEGKEYKPEDYLVAFSRFVEENRNTIDALQILLDRPSDWGVDALNDLRNRLAAASPLRFEEEKLRIAHEKALHKSMADIISMVRHAARNEEGLFTAEERVTRAMMRITGGIDFTPEQMEWLQRIRVHLVKNLSIGRDDFDCIPVFSSAGGWGRADRVFGGTLPQLILRLNEAVATAS
jgi:type I restriction enzyme R subunit